jgi:hypothetical protein
MSFSPLHAKTSHKSKIQRVSLEQEAKAPFRGILLSRAAIAKIISDYEAKISQLSLKLEREKKFRVIDKKYAEKKLELRKKACDARITILTNGMKGLSSTYDSELQRYRNPPWYKSSQFHFTMGVVVGGGVCGLVVLAGRSK